MKSFLTLLLLVASVFAANTKIVSREYKLMLDPSLFSGNHPENAVSQYWNNLETLIHNNLNRASFGSLLLQNDRTVAIYDTAGSCLLYRNHLIFRERVENSHREVTLKYRSADRYIAGHQDMSGSKSDAKTKFEEDISAPFFSKFSHSTTQSISNSKNLNKLDDPIRLYPDLEKYDFNDSIPIVKVSGLTVHEKVYRGSFVDLGNKDAEFSLTLWYTDTSSTDPVLAEISFKYKDKDEHYTEKVTTRAKKLFEAMQSMTNYNSQTSLTKTAYIYKYNESFCY